MLILCGVTAADDDFQQRNREGSYEHVAVSVAAVWIQKMMDTAISCSVAVRNAVAGEFAARISFKVVHFALPLEKKTTKIDLYFLDWQFTLNAAPC